jgi:hypothetical protein
MFQRLLLNTAILTLSTLMACSLAHAWSEPAIAPVMMTAPLTPPPVTGSTFYVDRNNLGGTCNNNNPGTQTQPWCTIGKATTTLTAGQRAYVRAGTYPEGGLRPTNAGTPGNYITFEAYPGESPVINCTGQTFCWDGVSGAHTYVVWNGFEAYGPKQQLFVCTNSNCHHVWFVNGKYHDSGSTFEGFQFSQHHLVFSNNIAYNMPVHPVGSGGHDNILEWNLLYDNGRNTDDEGVLKCGVNSYNCIIRYNTAYNNYRDPASTTPPFNGSCYQGITGFYIDVGIDSDGAHPGAMSYMYNNISFDNDIGLQIYHTKGARIFNNIAYHNGFTAGASAGWCQNFGHGLTIEGAQTDIQVFNNTVYGNRNRGINYGGAPNGVVISRNNISMNNGTDFASFNISNGNYNYDLMFNNVGGVLINWGGTVYTSLASFRSRPGNTTWLNAVGSAATFVNAAGGNFHLTSTSAGKDAGTALTLCTYDYDNHSRPQGSAWDIGADEYTSDDISLSPPTNLRVEP